ncbi:PKD domain-containing protein [Geodermatophilus sabuli]|uniref:LPXTG-motif cell wall anchor domain-containing protein n=1 Tax=Geodermatophilus sabuli TaxID=1564158 RepID=A0A285EEU7_9ACTN|nr:PKD domain-containing protein [Geodermatophilus sabuli]MBB3086402.1 LPXTG-motif cell wall-anchored protein [Geodermatophilus sabuli]SNX97383.1 LPXTG-motif cell wall anchor domain-containing protein [Geodermatophilus sabuli]
MKRTTSLVTAGAMGLGTFALVSAVAPSIASANGCGVTEISSMEQLTTVFDGALSGFGDGGNAELLPEGLHMTTDASDSAYAGYFMDGLGIPLAQATAPSNYALDVTQAAGQPLSNHPTYEMWVDLDGTGALPSWLVYFQPATGDPADTWWSEVPLTEVDPQASEAIEEATLVEISAAYPNAVIHTMGFQLVYSPDADAVVHGMTFGCNDFVFAGEGTTDPENQAPTASFTSTNEGGAYTFSATASDPDGEIVTHTWDFGDGTAPFVGGTEAQHTYTTAGDYTVTLTVVDDDGAAFTTELPITVVLGGGGDPTDPTDPEPTEYGTPLPNTGANVLGMAAIGGLVLAGGGAGLVASRRRKAGSAS